MKKFLAIVIIAALLLPDLTNAGIWIDFILRQDYIAKVLCIQKEEPVNICQGKCFLSQQLLKAQQEQKENLPESFCERLELWFGPVKATPEWMPVPMGSAGVSGFGLKDPLCPRFPVFDLLRPPEALLI